MTRRKRQRKNDESAEHGGRTKCWIAVLNDPTRQEFMDFWFFNKASDGPVPDEWELGYIIIGTEHFEISNKSVGMPHLQMYIEFVGNDYGRGPILTELKKWFPRAHFEKRWCEKPEAARDYCKKEGKWQERGIISCDRDGVDKKD